MSSILKRLDLSRPGSVVLWAMAFGVLAGLIAASYFSVAGEPAIEDAIAIEEAAAAEADDGHSHSHAGEDGEDSVEISRGVQRGVGLFVGYAIIGAIAGLLLAVMAMGLRGPWLDPFRRFVLAGSILAGAYTLIPWFKYPPNPPAVGDPDTVARRTILFWLLVVLAGLVLAGVAHLSARLRQADWDASRRIAVTALAVAVGIGVITALLPANTDPVEVPATLMWRFRTASLIGNLTMWGLLSVGFGLTAAEATNRRSAEATSQNSMPLSADNPVS